MSVKAIGYAASVGKTSVNQDSFLCDNKKGVYGVFDGVGQSFRPEKGSELASVIFRNAAQELGSMERDDQLVAPWLCQTMQSAHDAVTSIGSSTTASLIVICDDFLDPNLLTLNVGDSRVYGFKRDQQRLYQITSDDSFAKDSRLDNVESQQDMTQSMEMMFRFRHVVSRALGVDSTGKKIQLGELVPSVYPLENFDAFLLTTDGVPDNLSSREILNTLLTPGVSPAEIPDLLINAALKRSEDLEHIRHKKDDITAVYVTIEHA